jgi:GTPase SAR1 family protein
LHFLLPTAIAEIKKKLVIVGDAACGKTCLIRAFIKEPFQELSYATIFENYEAMIEVDGKQVRTWMKFHYTHSRVGYHKEKYVAVCCGYSKIPRCIP